MARIALCLWLLILTEASTLQAQSRVYFGVTTSADAGERGNIPGGAVPAVGGLVGMRLTDAWSIELEVDQGFRTTTSGSGEAVIVSFPPSRNPTYEEIQLYGIRARSDRRQTAGPGWSAHAAWRTREAGRINVGLLGGVSSRVYTSHLTRTTTFVSPLLNLPPNYQLPDENSKRRMTAGGFSGGIVIFVHATRGFTVAPEFRFTAGLITDDPYKVFRFGVRAMWSF